MKAGNFRVIRRCWINGELCEKGHPVTLEDRRTIGSLLELGRIEPADDGTGSRINTWSQIEWAEPPPDSYPRLKFVNRY